MAYNPELTDRVRQALAGVTDVKELKMFGSIGFKVNDKLCLGVGDHADHQMMVRVGPDAYEVALKRKGANPAIMRGRDYRGYIFVTSEGLKTQNDIDYWVGLALDFNKTLTSKK